MTVVVREATPAEYEALGALTVAAYAVYTEAHEDGTYTAELRDVAGRSRACPIYVALDDGSGRVLGGAMYVPGPGNPYAEVEREDEAGFRMLAVAPEAQGRGAGTALVEALMARARADGRRGMALLTLASMTTAHRIYGRLGFHRDSARDWRVEPGFVLLCFAIDFAAIDGAAAAAGARIADPARAGRPTADPSGTA
jgi:GNAT superfamily N-acetyltransferase